METIIAYVGAFIIGLILGLLGGGGSILTVPLLVYTLGINPVLATAYSLFVKKWDNNGITRKGYEIIMESRDNTIAFIVGNIVAFIVAILAIKFFINYLKKYGFRVFGIYRIIVGVILLGLIAAGYL